MRPKPGLYTLKRDVQNPNPRKGDGTRRNDWRRRPTVPAGTEVLVSLDPFLTSDLKRDVLTMRLKNEEVHDKTAWFEALSEALQPKERSMRNILETNRTDGQSVLKRLIAMGKITLDDIEEAAEAEMAKLIGR